MNNDEILIRMGVDSTAVGRALRGVRGSFDDWARGMKGTITDFAKSALGPIATVLSFSAVKSAIGDAVDYAVQMKKLGGETATSASFMQGLASAMRRFKIDAEEGSTAMRKLAQNVGEARSGSAEMTAKFAKWKIDISGKGQEDIFYQIAERARAMKDPTERAAMAVELLGKAAAGLAPAMAIGGDAMRSMIDGSNKLSDVTVEKLAIIDRKLASFHTKWRTLWGGLAAWGAGMFGVHAEAPSGSGITDEMIGRKIAELRDSGKLPRPVNTQGMPSQALGYVNLGNEKLNEEAREKAITILMREQAKLAVEQAAAQTKQQVIQANIAHAEELQKQAVLDRLSLEERAQQLSVERAQIALRLVDWNTAALDRSKAMVELERVGMELRKTNLELEKQRSAEREKQLSLTKKLHAAEASRRETEADLATAKSDRSRWTLGELASQETGHWENRRHGRRRWISDVSPSMGADISTAREVQDLEEASKWADTDAEANRLLGQADKLRAGIGRLKTAERDPFAAMEKSIASADAGIQEIRELMKGAGINANVKL